MTDDPVLESALRENVWLRRTNDAQRAQILGLELEIARLQGRNQGLEMLARAIDNYPMGEYPPLQALPPRTPPSGLR